MVRSSGLKLAFMKWANQLVNHTTTNEPQCYLRKVSMVWSSGRRLAVMKWSTSTSTNLSVRQLSATWEWSPWSGARVASGPLWDEATNLSTRQLIMNFSGTWERSPWSGARVASWPLWGGPPRRQSTNQTASSASHSCIAGGHTPSASWWGSSSCITDYQWVSSSCVTDYQWGSSSCITISGGAGPA